MHSGTHTFKTFLVVLHKYISMDRSLPSEAFYQGSAAWFPSVLGAGRAHASALDLFAIPKHGECDVLGIYAVRSPEWNRVSLTRGRHSEG